MFRVELQADERLRLKGRAESIANRCVAWSNLVGGAAALHFITTYITSILVVWMGFERMVQLKHKMFQSGHCYQ